MLTTLKPVDELTTLGYNNNNNMYDAHRSETGG
jgi:hypothetical protein